MQALSRRQVREIDRRAVANYGMSSLVLMENAGRGTADLLCRLIAVSPVSSGSVAICCGKGNNGGDGFVVARHLDLRGVPVRVLLLCDPAEFTGDAAANFRILGHCGVPIVACCAPAASAEGSPVFSQIGFDQSSFDAELARAGWIVDALLGTGATGNPRPPYDQAIRQINAANKPTLAIDLPSGLDCDTGEAFDPTIRAAHTCTFVATKPGFSAPGAANFTGQVHVQDIGAPRRLIEEIRREVAQ